MKQLLLVFLTTLISISAMATDINLSEKNRSFDQYESILKAQVSWAQIVLDEYVEEELGCSRVRFNLNIKATSRVFSKGNFDLSLTATCTETFNDFKFVFYDGFDEDYTTLDISFVKNGQLTKKKFKTDAWY